jgi:hypothetical protein
MSYEVALARRKALKTKLQRRQRLFGAWLSYTDPEIT